MTYEEIKTRLTQCETKLQGLKQTKPTSGNVANYNLAVKKLEVLKESLSKKLSEAEKTAFVNGQATEYEDEKELNKLKDNQDVKSIKTASGKKIKEQQGVTFSVEETSAIAKKTGKAVAMGLKALGDEVAHMKAKKIEENSFEIYVEYKNGSDDQFSFYISDDTLHLVDFSFDKELVDVGVKPSGEAIVNVDVLSNELQKHWKSMKEGMSDQEFADAQENDRLNKHPEKDTILKIKALLAKEKQNQLNEVPKGMFYIEVSIRDARKALAIIDDQPALKHAVQIDDSNRYYLTDEVLAYDLMMDFNAHDVEVVDTNIDEDNLEEYKSDYAKRRAAERDYQPSKRDVPPKKYKEPSNDYFARRKAEMDEGEKSYHIHGRPVQVNKGAKSDGTDWTVTFTTDTSMAKKGKTVPLHAVLALIEPKPAVTKEADYNEAQATSVADVIDPADYIEIALNYLDGMDDTHNLSDDQLEDLGRRIVKQLYKGDFKAAMARHGGTNVNETEVDTDGGDLDVGHQDDEPDMLMKDIYDIATYAAKLHKMLKKYNDFDGEVDFPHWWQKKVTLARDYISAAQHYLEAEEKQPALDQLALENASAGKEDKFHKDLDKLVHKTFGHSSDEKKKTVKEDWGSSDHAHMMRQIHKAIGEPDRMPSPFDSNLESAVQDNVDFYWDDWAEYQEDPEQLYDKAKRDYLRYFFKDTFNKMVRMFEPVNESLNEGTELYNRNGIQIKRFSGGQRGVMVQITIGDKYIVVPAEEYPFLVRAMQSVQEDLKDMSRQYPRSKNMQEGFGKTKKAYDLVVNKMKELAKVYKSGDTSVIAQLKDLTAKKKELEKMLEKQAGGIGAGQELDPNASETKINEEKATCCGKCGRVHVKGTKCKTPYLKGKDHCRYN